LIDAEIKYENRTATAQFQIAQLVPALTPSDHIMLFFLAKFLARLCAFLK
jgi:hypothetical protein